jgi:putative transposase
MYMNGKIESLWTSVEARLMAMLERVTDLTLATLNEATQAWCEYEYNRALHSEIRQTPLARYLAGPDVLRPSPDSDALRLAFTRTDKRVQRRSDGTLVIATRRFEIPNRYRHLREIHVRYAQWDLSQVHLLDQRSGKILCRLYPQDKDSNARGVRRPLEPLASAQSDSADRPQPPRASGSMAPLLVKLMAQQTATGLPPAYLPMDEPSSTEGKAP